MCRYKCPLTGCMSPLSSSYYTKDSSTQDSDKRDLTGEPRYTIQHPHWRRRPRQLQSTQQSSSRSRTVGPADQRLAFGRCSQKQSVTQKYLRECRVQLHHKLHRFQSSALSSHRRHIGTRRKPFTRGTPVLLSLSQFHTIAECASAASNRVSH